MPANLFKLALTAAFSLLFLFSLIAVYVNDQFSVLVSEDSVFTIESGSTLSAITKRLTVDDLLPVNNIAFKTFALLTRGKGSIQAGQYQLKAGMPSHEVLAWKRGIVPFASCALQNMCGRAAQLRRAKGLSGVSWRVFRWARKEP